MKILFIYPCRKIEKTINHGIASLSAVLKNKGHITDIAYLDSTDFNTITTHLETFKPDLLALYAITNQWDIIKNFTKKNHQNFNIPIIIGGPHVTSTPQAIEEIP